MCGKCTGCIRKKAGKESRYYAEVISDGKVYADSLDREYFLTAEIEGNFAEYMLSNHAYVKRLEDQSEILKKAEKINIFLKMFYFKENPGKMAESKRNLHDNLSSRKCGIYSGRDK